MRTYIPTGYALIEWVFKLNIMARKMSSTLGISITAVPTLAQVDTLFLNMALIWGPRLPTHYSFMPSTLWIGNGAAPPTPIVSSITGAGSNANTLLVAPSVTHVVKKNTALGGRKGKGRMYIPGLKEGGIDNAGQLDPAGQATYNTSLAQIKTSVEGLSWVGNLYLLGHSAANPPVQITSLTMRDKSGTQVRRVRDA